MFPWKFGLETKEKVGSSKVEERGSKRKRKEGPVDHELVLRALSRALEMTELAYLDMTDKVLDTNPELALMGSCLLVVLMRDEDVYVMNVGDSRAIVAQYEPEDVGSSVGGDGYLLACGHFAAGASKLEVGIFPFLATSATSTISLYEPHLHKEMSKYSILKLKFQV